MTESEKYTGNSQLTFDVVGLTINIFSGDVFVFSFGYVWVSVF